MLILTKVCSSLQCSWVKVGLRYSKPQKKSAKFNLFKDFQFYSQFSSLLISRSYLIPTVSSRCQEFELKLPAHFWKLFTNLKCWKNQFVEYLIAHLRTGIWQKVLDSKHVLKVNFKHSRKKREFVFLPVLIFLGWLKIVHLNIFVFVIIFQEKFQIKYRIVASRSTSWLVTSHVSNWIEFN